MRKSVVAVLAAPIVLGALSGIGASPVAAAEDEITVSVGFADLNLDAPAGSAALEQRIATAVKEVCAKPDIRNLKAMTAWEECKASARIGALDQLSFASPYEGLALASVF